MTIAGRALIRIDYLFYKCSGTWTKIMKIILGTYPCILYGILNYVNFVS